MRKSLRYILLIITIFSITNLSCRFAQEIISINIQVSGDIPVHEAPAKILPIECTEDGCIDACLQRLNTVVDIQQHPDLQGYYAEAANIDMVTYLVQDGRLSEPDILWVPEEYKPYQEDFATHQKVWKFFTDIIPAKLRQPITEFRIYTDGREEVLAWVDTSQRFEDGWVLGIDILDAAYPPELTDTLVHEIGHILTLDSSQFELNDEDWAYSPIQNLSVCPQYMDEDGCSLPGSYINLFYQRFWKDIYEEWWDIEQHYDDENYDSLVEDFYDRYEEQFVSDYAATNIDEDLAETWAMFILNPRPEGSSIAEQKILFFYEFPELVEARQQIIKGVCSYLQE